jgi:hypothetical protein
MTRPDHLLVLRWNLKQEIIEQMHHDGDWGRKFIVAIANVEVIDLADIAT